MKTTVTQNWSNIQRRSVIFTCISAPSLCLLSHLALPVAAQPPGGRTSVSKTMEQSGWADILKNDLRIYAARVSWKRVIRAKPDAGIDVEKAVVEAVERARQENKSPGEIKSTEQVVRALARQDKDGFINNAILDFIRVGGTVRCDIKTIFPAKTLYSLDFYDGKNAVSMSLNSPANDAVKDDDVMHAILTRKESEFLAHSAGQGLMAQFLLGFPLSYAVSPSNPTFTPTNSLIREGENDTLILEKQLGSGPSPFAQLIKERLIISKKHLRPIAYERLGPEQKVQDRIVIESYQEYGDGIWFPSKITMPLRGKTTIEYSLVKAEFNEAITPEEVSLPLNTRLTDIRFGPDNLVTYRLTTPRLPEDEEVRQMLEEQ